MAGAQAPEMAAQQTAEGAKAPAPAGAQQQPVKEDEAGDGAAQRMALDCLLQMGFLVVSQPRAADTQVAQAGQAPALAEPLAALQGVGPATVDQAGLSLLSNAAVAAGLTTTQATVQAPVKAEGPATGAPALVPGQERAWEALFAKPAKDLEANMPVDLAGTQVIATTQTASKDPIPASVLLGQRAILMETNRSAAAPTPTARPESSEGAQELATALWSQASATARAASAPAGDVAGKAAPVTETVVLDPMNSKTWQDVANRIQITYVQGGTEARIHLWPPELGRIEVRLQVSGQQVGVQLEATTPRAQQILQDNVMQLRSALSDQGLDVRTLSISLGHGGMGQHSMGQHRGWDFWNGEAPAAAPWFDQQRDERTAPVGTGMSAGRGPLTLVDFMA
jgi:flagellar hook-length control protein FliK